MRTLGILDHEMTGEPLHAGNKGPALNITQVCCKNTFDLEGLGRHSPLLQEGAGLGVGYQSAKEFLASARRTSTMVA